MSQYELCKKNIIDIVFKRIAAPFVFGVVYFVLVSILLQFFKEGHSSLSIALVVLGILGFLYSAFYLFADKGIYFKKVKMSIIDRCIAKVNSPDYGDVIYYPLVKYKYGVGSKTFFSNRVCLDSRSCYLNVWYEKVDENKGLAYARQKLDEFSKRDYAYVLKIFPYISYLDISLRKDRKYYFMVLAVVSIICFVCGVVLI